MPPPLVLVFSTPQVMVFAANIFIMAQIIIIIESRYSILIIQNLKL